MTNLVRVLRIDFNSGLPDSKFNGLSTVPATAATTSSKKAQQTAGAHVLFPNMKVYLTFKSSQFSEL